ncbi:MAG: asparagine synthase (glutamine-hydrolyzing) [Deltaproteobacteria bacterium]|nr:asparagine synthase (glutamine-hydrolyzing) [Deltaproteobacteria bacterium]
MCGIFGFAGFEKPDLLSRMAATVHHRGPDGEGHFSEGRFSMGMRRLSIIDLEGGTQPIWNEDETLAVCFNGEIYNFVELREELQAAGHRFRTRSDTEVLVHAFEEWGEESLERLNGMFAFALWDRREKRLFLARDRAGQKPLYYWDRNGRLLFASEVKALLESDEVERRPNREAIDGYLALRYVPQPETLFDGVRVLPAGHCATWQRGELRVRRYWDVPLGAPEKISDADALDAFEELFLDSVRLTLRSDVPVAAYLSGGIDSSLVVAAMTRFNDRIRTFSIGFRSEIDETAEAATLARTLGTEHTEIHVEPEHFDELPRVIWHMERPVGDALLLAYWQLARETSKDFKVVLSGEGADESYAGYSFHKIIRWTERLRRAAPDALLRLGGATVDALPARLLDKLFVYPAFLGERGKAKTAEYLRRYPDRDLAQSYAALKALWDSDERRALALQRGHLPGPAAGAAVRRLAPGQPAAAPGQEHHGALPGAALPVPGPSPDRAGLPLARPHQAARPARQVGRARAGPALASAGERGPQQGALLPAPGGLLAAPAAPRAGAHDPGPGAGAPPGLLRSQIRIVAGRADAERRVPVPETGTVPGDPGAVAPGVHRQAASVVKAPSEEKA